MEVPDTADSAQSETLGAADSLIGLSEFDEHKRQYLAYRYTGFNKHEAARLSAIHPGSVDRWRRGDKQFAQAEIAATGKDAAVKRKELIHMLFVRNFHLVLMKDFEVFQRALGLEQMEIDDGDGGKVTVAKPLDAADLKYLLAARTHYNPQQMAAVEDLMQTGGKKFSFDQFLVSMAQSGGTMKVMLEASGPTPAPQLPSGNTVDGEMEDITGDEGEE